MLLEEVHMAARLSDHLKEIMYNIYPHISSSSSLCVCVIKLNCLLGGQLCVFTHFSPKLCTSRSSQ